MTPSTPEPHPITPPAIEAGSFQAYFIYDVADTIALSQLGSLIAGGTAARAPLQLRREASPGFIEFPEPPIVAKLPDTPDGIGIRAKFFDYGVISIKLTIPFAGTWNAFAAFTRELRSNEKLAHISRTVLDTLLADIATILDEPHPPLAEDYFIFAVQSFTQPIASAQLLTETRSALAALMLCEERVLASAEQEEALRVNFSYFDDDLAVVHWDTAFVYDRREGAGAVEDILEFANTQLVELRQHDALLDAELDTIYKLDAQNEPKRFGRKEAQQAADRVRFLIVDILELTDRASNALKIIGDAYYARLYRGAAQRLGLRDWQQQIDSKLQSIGEMYRFFNDQAQTARSEFLEIIIILLIVLEIIIGLLALLHH